MKQINQQEQQKSILFAFDGTGNRDYPGLNNPQDSNVRKFADAFLGEVFYQQGVGSEEGCNNWFTKKFDKITGGVFGLGGKKRVEKAIEKLKRVLVLTPNTVIYVVGFSRGAALALDFCNEVNRVFGGSVVIRFVGIFDAVASFGLPGNNVNIGYNFKLPHIVQNCFHAISLDERRTMFPLTRVEQDTLTDVAGSNIVPCLFRGFHSDVGGGNGNTGLSDIPLTYLVEKALKCDAPMDFVLQEQYAAGQHPEAECEKPFDMAPNDKRAISVTDLVHKSVSFRKWACEHFKANNPPQGLQVA